MIMGSVRQNDCSTFHTCYLQASQSSANIVSGLGNKGKSKHMSFKTLDTKDFRWKVDFT